MLDCIENKDTHSLDITCQQNPFIITIIIIIIIIIVIIALDDDDDDRAFRAKL